MRSTRGSSITFALPTGCPWLGNPCYKTLTGQANVQAPFAGAHLLAAPELSKLDPLPRRNWALTRWTLNCVLLAVCLFLLIYLLSKPQPPASYGGAYPGAERMKWRLPREGIQEKSGRVTRDPWSHLIYLCLDKGWRGHYPVRRTGLLEHF